MTGEPFKTVCLVGRRPSYKNGPSLLARVSVATELGTIVWPDGADVRLTLHTGAGSVATV